MEWRSSGGAVASEINCRAPDKSRSEDEALVHNFASKKAVTCLE